jgi:uncharacterized protein YdcH (DUF465 family)
VTSNFAHQDDPASGLISSDQLIVIKVAITFLCLDIIQGNKERDTMSNTPHTLGEEFPGQLDAIHILKAKDPAFAALLSEYDQVNDVIHKAESRIEPMSDEAETDLRRRRLSIKDAIAARLASGT